LSSSLSSLVAVDFRKEQMPAAVLPLSPQFLSHSNALGDDYAIGAENNISTVTASSSGFNNSDISALFSQIDSASSIAGDSIASRATTMSSRSSSSMRGDKFLPPPYSPGQFTKDNYLQIINGLIPVSSPGSTNVREELAESFTATSLQLTGESPEQCMHPAVFDDSLSSGSTRSASTNASEGTTTTSSGSQPQIT
jgi:hypothetical protein